MGKFNFKSLLDEEDFFVQKVEKFRKKHKSKSIKKVNEAFHGKVLIEVGKEELNKVLTSIEQHGEKSDFYGLKRVDSHLEYESRLREEFEDDLKSYKSAFKTWDINCTFNVKIR